MSKNNARGVYYMGTINLEALAEVDKDSHRLEIVMNAFIPICQCGHCFPHAFDCAVHNGELSGPCDCERK